MAVNPNWPLVVTQFSTADPFDAGATPVWNAFNPQPDSMGAASGRQYELNLVQAGEARYTLFDQAEALNPANTAGPYYPNIKPLRQLVDQAMWPPAPVGAAVNLLNLSALPIAYDPTFDTYTASAAVSWLTAVGGTAPVVGTTTPHAGANDVTWAVAGGVTVQGVRFPVPCIPGQQYTASVYIRQTTASTQQISVVGGAAGSSTAATGAWVLISVTFTATLTSHTIQVATTGTAVAGTVLLDDVQHEPGASASARSTTGPVIYGVFGGFVERWPRSWADGGVRGMCQLTCVDSLSVLAGQSLQTEYRNAVLAKAPALYWPLAEPSGATTFAEYSGGSDNLLTRYDGPAGPAPAFAAGTSTGIAGDPNGLGVKIAETAITPPILGPASIVESGFPIPAGFTWSVGTGFPVGWSSSFWLTRTRLQSINVWFMAIQAANHNPTIIAWNINPQPGGSVQFAASLDGVHSYSVATAADTWDDGKPHHYVGTLSATNTTWTATLYIDGAVAATATGSTTGWPTPPYVANQVQIGSTFYTYAGSNYGDIPNAVYAHVAAWGRALSAGEVTDLWNAGQGYPGETPGARIARYLSYNWIGPTALDAGQSVMGVSNLGANTSVLTAAQAVTTSENGRLFADPTNLGAPTFQARTHDYLATAPKWVLGELELPYEEDIAYDYDPTQVWTDVQVTRVGGITAIGGTQATIAAAQKASGKKTYTRTINTNSDLEAQDAANWIFNGHSSAVQRIAVMTIKPSSNPALWPMALGARIGDRITVHRRTSSGTAMVADYFIEKITHDRKVDDQNMTWTVAFEASPAAVSRQPWILDSAAYSVLGTSTTLGY